MDEVWNEKMWNSYYEKKRVVTYKRLKLPNIEEMKDVENEGYTHLGIVELDKNKEWNEKRKNNKEYKWMLWLVLKSN